MKLSTTVLNPVLYVILLLYFPPCVGVNLFANEILRLKKLIFHLTVCPSGSCVFYIGLKAHSIDFKRVDRIGLYMTFSASIIRRHMGGSTTQHQFPGESSGVERLSRSIPVGRCKPPLSKDRLLTGNGLLHQRWMTLTTQVIFSAVGSMLVLVTILIFVATHDFGQTAHSFKISIKHLANGVWEYAEVRGIIDTAPAIMTDYHTLYPEFQILEANTHVIQQEFAILWATNVSMIDMEHLNYKHKQLWYNWKAFSLNVAGYLPGNTRLMPQTTALLRQIPDVHSAMFSVMGPKQIIGPHFGIWKGLRRYHLGIDIPNNNADENMWLRVNPDVVKGIGGNTDSEKALAYEGDVYYWKDGQGGTRGQ
jgi:Aspartyl/Asparaginyl beta-hydroxylase